MNQGLLWKTKAYLIGGMEFENGRDWRQKATERLSSIGVVVFDPYHKPFLNTIKEDEESRKYLKQKLLEGDFDFVHHHMKQVRNDDLRMCDLSSFFIIKVNPTIPSWGSAEELTTINRQKKPVFVCVDGGKTKCPLWILGMLPPKYIYNSVDEAINLIEKINSGEIIADSDRWRLLLPQYR